MLLGNLIVRIWRIKRKKQVGKRNQAIWNKGDQRQERRRRICSLSRYSLRCASSKRYLTQKEKSSLGTSSARLRRPSERRGSPKQS